jgi:hypothetical protein
MWRIARRFKLGAAFNMIAAASQMGCGAQYRPLATTAERFLWGLECK